MGFEGDGTGARDGQGAKESCGKGLWGMAGEGETIWIIKGMEVSGQIGGH